MLHYCTMEKENNFSDSKAELWEDGSVCEVFALQTQRPSPIPRSHLWIVIWGRGQEEFWGSMTKLTWQVTG